MSLLRGRNWRKSTYIYLSDPFKGNIYRKPWSYCKWIVRGDVLRIVPWDSPPFNHHLGWYCLHILSIKQVNPSVLGVCRQGISCMPNLGIWTISLEQSAQASYFTQILHIWSTNLGVFCVAIHPITSLPICSTYSIVTTIWLKSTGIYWSM